MRHSCIIHATSRSASVQRSMSSRKLPARVSAPASQEIDLARAYSTVLDLMAIPAKSGEEAPVAAYIRERLLAAGAPAEAIITDNTNKHALIAGNTGNLIFKLPGTIKAPRRMLSAHMDTVPICIGSQP